MGIAAESYLNLYPNDKKLKEQLKRASLRARFVKAANNDGTQNLDNSSWEVYLGDNLLLTASVADISGNRSGLLYDSIATKEFWGKLTEEEKDTILNIWRELWQMGYSKTSNDYLFEFLNEIEQKSILLDIEDESVFDKETSSLSYKVSSPHFEASGIEASGSYDLSLRSDVARCIYGFSKAPINATISITSSDGVPQIATTVIGEKMAGFTCVPRTSGSRRQ